MTDEASVRGTERRGRRIAIALTTWLACAAVLGAATWGAIAAAGSEDALEELTEYHPLEPGTTWVYETTTDGEPTGKHFAQVTGVAHLGLPGTTLTLAGRFENFAGFGPAETVSYLIEDGDGLSQVGFRSPNGYQKFSKPIPVYDPPFEVGRRIDYKGEIEGDPVTQTAEIVAIEDVEVRGRNFSDCLKIESSYKRGKEPLERATDWLCPGVGSVQIERVGPEFTILEELVAFSTPGRHFGETQKSANLDAPLEEVDIDNVAWTDSRPQRVSFEVGSDGEIVVTGEDDGTVTATNATTGEVRWRVGLEPPITTSPLVASGTVLIGGGNKSLYALDSRTGLTKWAAALPDVPSSTPVVSGDNVVLAVDDLSVRALALDDGEERWTGETPALVRTRPLASEGRIVVPSEDGTLTAFDAETGDALWDAEVGSLIDAGPVISGDVVALTDDTAVAQAFDVSTGELMWSESIGERTFGVALDDETFFLHHGDALEAWDASDGTSRWRITAAESHASPIVAGNQIVTISLEGEVTAYDSSSGEISQSIALPSVTGIPLDVDLPLVHAGGLLFATVPHDVVERRYSVVALGGEGGGGSFDVNRYSMGSTPAAAPAASDDAVFAGDTDGVLWRSDGETFSRLGKSKSTSWFTVVGEDLVLSQEESEVVARSLSGDEKWRAPMAEPQISTRPLIHEGRVYVPIVGQGLTVYDAATGTPVWVDESPGGVTGGAITPIGDSIAYIGNGIRVVDKRTGKERWSVPDVTSFAPMAGDDSTLVAATIALTGPSYLVAYEANSGEERWRVEWDPSAFIGPVLENGVVVAVNRVGRVVAIDVQSGEELWSIEMEEVPAGPAAIVDDLVFVASQARDEDLLQRTYRISAHDLRTGRFLGSYEPPGSGFNLAPGFAQAGERLLVPTTGAAETPAAVEVLTWRP